MERQPPLPMTPFDTLVTSSELQMMKLLLPYTPASQQRMFAFYIKFMELQNTIRNFGLFRRGQPENIFGNPHASPADILNELKPYIGKEADTIDMILSAMSMMEMMQGMDMPDPSQMGDLSGMMDMMNMFAGQSPPAESETETTNGAATENMTENTVQTMLEIEKGNESNE